MADTPTIQTPQTADQMTGVSNPPSGGFIKDVSVQGTDNQTVPQTQAPNEPPSSSPQQTTGNTNAPQDGTQGPQNSQDISNAKASDLSKPQVSNKPVQNTPLPSQPNPMVKKAGIFHDIAETLAGGPRYTYSVDAYGNTQKQKVPVSNGHLALAIAMEALGGAAAGFGVKPGPDAVGRAAAAGFQQQEQQRVQQDQEARQQASQDYARRMQTTETNMRMYTMARQVGKMDADQVDSYIGQYKDLAEKLKTEFPGYVEGPVKYSDFAKYHVTQQNAIPYMRVERLDQNGKQVVDSHGVPQWDIDYLIVNPNLKSSGLLSKQDVQALQEMGQGWANNELIGDTPLNLSLALSKKSQAASWEVAKDVFAKFGDTLNEANDAGVQTGGQPTTAPKLAPQLDQLVDQTAQQYGVNPAWIKGIIQMESGGNTSAVSPTGAIGLMQLTQATANQFGVTDRNNPQQNISGGTQYFSQLLNKFKNPKLALAAYYSGPGAIQNGKIIGTNAHSVADTKRYVDGVANLVGLQEPQNNGEEAEYKPNDMKDWVKKFPTFPADVEAFMGALGGTDGNYSQALQHMIASKQSDAASHIASFLGGPDNIRKHDMYIANQEATAKADIQTTAQAQRAANKDAQDQAAEQTKINQLTTLDNATIPQGALHMKPMDVIKNLQGQGVNLPSYILDDALATANYDSSMADMSNRTWFKDKNFTRQEFEHIVRTLNPDWSESNYENLARYNNPNSPVMKTIAAGSAISYHLKNLLDVAKEVNSNGNGTGQFPLLNRLENEYNYHTGGTAYSQLAGLTNAINGEMGKVLSGGFAPDKEQTEALMKNMTPENSLNQINQLSKLYIDVMYGKIRPYDETYSQLKNGTHLKAIPQALTNLFQSYHLDTPWAQQNKNIQNTPQSNPNEKPVIVNGKTIGYTVDGKTISRVAQAQ